MTDAANPPDFWNTLFRDFNSSCKLWFEGFDIPTYIEPHEEKYEIEPIKIPGSVIKALHAFSKHHHIPLEHLIHAAWGLLLHRYSSMSDIVFGTSAVPNKNKLLPVRSIIDKNDSVIHYIKKIHAELKEEKKHIKEMEESFYDRLLISYVLFISKKISKEKDCSG